MTSVERFTALTEAAVALDLDCASYRESAARCTDQCAAESLGRLAASNERAAEVVRQVRDEPPAPESASQLEQAVRALLIHPVRAWLVVNHYDAFQRLVDLLDGKPTTTNP